MNGALTPSDRPLAGRRVVTTRELAGTLDDHLRRLGAEVIHLPLIEVLPPADGGAALSRALTAPDRPFDWVIVTSRHGAAAVGAHPSIPVRTAAVGRSTASVLEQCWGRPVDLVPATQRAVGLLDALARICGDGPRWHILVAQADRADATLVEGLRRLGHEVEAVVAYRTVVLVPEPSQREVALGADAVTFASGSAAEAWARSIGTVTPPVVCAIGPSTARVADRHGLTVTHIAQEHSVEGLVLAVVAALSD